MSSGTECEARASNTPSSSSALGGLAGEAMLLLPTLPQDVSTRSVKVLVRKTLWLVCICKRSEENPAIKVDKSPQKPRQAAQRRARQEVRSRNCKENLTT